MARNQVAAVAAGPHQEVDLQLIVEGGHFRRAMFDDVEDVDDGPVLRAAQPTPTQIIYETPRGHVRQIGSGVSRQYVITRVLEDGRSEEQAFSEDLVDAKVRAADFAGPPAARAPRAAPLTEDGYFDYQGDVHKVIDVEGIGPIFAQRLQEHGVHTTARLRYEPVEQLARWANTAPGNAAQWQVMSELIAINGVGPQYAEAMARSGISGIAELKDRKAADIASQVQTYLQSLNQTVLGNEVTAKRVKGWQKAARKMKKVRQPVPLQ